MTNSENTVDIVIPVYNEGSHIYDNIMEIKKTLDQESISHRFILVDDGSKDNTWEALLRIQTALGQLNVTCLRFSRNFGKEAALCAGIMEVTKECCVIMDSDLQHPPSMIGPMYKKFQEGYDIVEGVKADRGKESGFSRVAAKSFYWFMKRISGFDMDNSSDFKILSRRVIEAWKQVGDSHTFFRGMVEWVGFEKVQIPFYVEERRGGTTKFSTLRLIRLALNAITSYSSAPLYLTNLLAAGFFIGAVILGIQTIYNKISGHAESGFSTVILLILILGAAILFCLGIIGTYLSKIYDEVKRRPRYIVKDRL